jgi:hypothetical protein
MTQPLKLRAEDADDLRVIAACLQDALIPLSDIEYQSIERSFTLIANRFRWENCDEAVDDLKAIDPGLAVCGTYERVNCVIVFETLETVKRRGFEPHDRGRILELLTMEIEAGEGDGMAVTMLFAGGAAIRLDGKKIRCRIGDLGEPWPTQWRPYHPTGDAA